jgi:hypothetical protein
VRDGHFIYRKCVLGVGEQKLMSEPYMRIEGLGRGQGTGVQKSI